VETSTNVETGRGPPLRILMCLIFYPRGGSSHVTRYLSQALIKLGHQVHLVAGSLRDGNPQHDADVFYDGLPLTTVDYTDAWQGFHQGRDPISAEWTVPFHPSYEDKPDVPDRVFYKVDRGEYDALLRSWRNVLCDAGQGFQPDALHLHHANHMHVAAAEVFPTVPKALQFHGTEIKMLENLDRIERESGVHGDGHGLWREVLATATRPMHHFFAISPDVRQRAMDQFPIRDGDITTVPNGVDVSLFKPMEWADEDRLGFLREILVEDPHGWDESSLPGSVCYTEADLGKFRDSSGGLKPVAMFVGRFLDFKRVPLLIRAVARVNERFEKDDDWPPFNLIVWGGMPGEWEGEHPHTLTCELGLPNVFFTGWLPHDVLRQGLNLADVFVAPSYYEPFGQVFLEAMATGLPVIATRSGGPLSYVVDDGLAANGWFSDVDDVDSLAPVLYDALTDAQQRERCGENALALIREKYSWMGIARTYESIYQRLISRG